MKKEPLDWSLVEDGNRLLEDIPVPGPSREMDEKFYAILEREKKNQASQHQDDANLKKDKIRNLHPAWWVAASITLFMIGWIGATMMQTEKSAGSEISGLSAEVKELKESLVLTMIRHDSPDERIRAVSLVSEMNTIDSKIIESLMITLNNDANENVRLTALGALVKYAHMPEVREGLIKSIDQQSSPQVLSRLTEIMAKLQEKRSVPEFMNRIMDVNLDFNTRTKLNETVRFLL